MTTASPIAPFDALEGRVNVDVAVIGAGVAGVSTALHLAEAGREVVLLEAAQPGAGATGQSGGLIAPNFINMTPVSAEETLGEDRGRRLTQLVGSSAARCFDLIRRHDLDCDANQDGFWTPAHTEALAQEQKRQAEEWRTRGYDVAFVDGAATREALGSHRYVGALRFGDGGYVNPLALVRQLSLVAQRVGVRIHGDSPVKALRRDGARWIVETPKGAVSAGRVVLAANGGSSHLHKALRHSVIPLHVIEFATEPLSAEQRARVLPVGGSFTDKQAYLFTARFDGDGRLISAFPVSAPLWSLARMDAEARLRLRRHFPGLGPIAIESLWKGTCWLTPSLRPQMYDLGEGAYAIQACNGRGIATNLALGAELAGALATNDFSELSTPLETAAPIRLHAVARYAPYAMMTMAYLHSRSLKRVPAPPSDA